MKRWTLKHAEVMKLTKEEFQKFMENKEFFSYEAYSNYGYELVGKRNYMGGCNRQDLLKHPFDQMVIARMNQMKENGFTNYTWKTKCYYVRGGQTPLWSGGKEKNGFIYLYRRA